MLMREIMSGKTLEDEMRDGVVGETRDLRRGETLDGETGD